MPHLVFPRQQAPDGVGLVGVRGVEVEHKQQVATLHDNHLLSLILATHVPEIQSQENSVTFQLLRRESCGDVKFEVVALG